MIIDIINLTDIVILILRVYEIFIYFNKNIKIDNLDETLFIFSCSLLSNISGYYRRILEERGIF
jgi:hypothetical protein